MTERLGIVGGGAIARGIARVACEHGDVVMWVRSPDKVKAPEDVEVTSDLDALDGSDVVVEAISEDLEAKRELYARLPPLDGALLCTTTSSLSVNALAEASGRADHFVGLHVFNPVHKMDLVELAFPDAATDETRRRAHALCDHLGKTAVEVPDVPGFVVNRLLFPYLFSAVRLQEETGLDARAIDTCMKLGAGHPMGPLALLDLVGLDVSIAIGETIGADVPARVRQLADEGALGRKAGRGFHVYDP
ncbi:MAG: 3-hydroxyacyl-CoA dehydrogenase family protein [Actinomycetota bacterium]|nr:3-hydroxyacyl-CoA dehydrogenase family protein [Actinomycetota bacterium]MDQ5808411.1 3-hydroxyacyl-CoA dehydrogenase family protein [Actinomycetota bacterium]